MDTVWSIGISPGKEPLPKTNIQTDHSLMYIYDAFFQGIAKNLENPSLCSESLRDGGGGAYFNDYMNWREIDEFAALVWKSPAARIAGRLMGSDSV